jgi:hypothetical protein
MKISNLLMIAALSVVCSCNDFLDIAPDNIATIDHAFNNRTEAEKYLYGCFSFLPFFGSPDANPALLGCDEVWYIDPTAGVNPRLWHIALGNQGTNLPLANYWESKQNEHDSKYNTSGYNFLGGKALFTALNDCNIFLENIHKPYDLQQYERERWTAEVKFLKAFYHFWLFRMYGPIPLIKENLPISAGGDAVQRFREPVDDVVNYIVELLDEAASKLPETIENVGMEMGRPTSIAALALKAQVLTYAASPLFNGNTDYSGYVDKRGVQLFPQRYDHEKWKRAADALKIAIDTALAVGHGLYDFGTENQYASYLHQKTNLAMAVRGAVTERWNRELIWADSRPYLTDLQLACCPPFTSYHFGGVITKCYAPPLHIVEQFYTKNGVPIDEDKDWAGVDPMGKRVAAADDRWYIKQGHETINLHFDREARFYGSIIFDGGTYYGNARLTNDNTTDATYMWTTPYEMYSTTVNLNCYPSTGYLCKKLIHYQTAFSDAAEASRSNAYHYAFPIIRLADLYLMYAEALNEYLDAPDAEVRKYVDLVRARTGLEGVEKSWNDYAVPGKQDKPLKKDGMREIIQRERMNELAFEGIRFWDLRRWKLAETYLNRTIQGLTVGLPADYADYYRVKDLYPMTFGRKDYFQPIKVSTLLKNPNLLQSPEW